MASSEKDTCVLQDMLKQAPDLVSLVIEEAAKSGYMAPLAQLVMNSKEVASRRLRPWSYKSLAEYGEEVFASSSGSWWFDPKDWARHAISHFSKCVMEQLWFHEEGLLFFVREGSTFRQARVGDPAYDFALRLIQEESVGDLKFVKPPSWADELYLQRENFDAYRLIWNYGDMEDPLYQESKAFRRRAVIDETRRTSSVRIEGEALGPIAGTAAGAGNEGGRWPWGSFHTELLGHLEAAARRWWVNFDPSDNTTAPRNEDVEKWLLQERGITERKARMIATMLRADGLPTGPRK